MAVVWMDTGFLRAGAVQQDDGLHTAGGIAYNSVVERKADRLAAAGAGCSVSGYGFGNGAAGHLVGTISSRHAGGKNFAGLAGTRSRREPRGLVLRGKTGLAIQPDLQLSALDNQSRRSVRLWLAGCGSWIMRCDCFCQAIRGAQCRGCGVVLRGDIKPVAGLHHALHLPLFVRRRPLSICRLYWLLCVGGGGNHGGIRIFLEKNQLLKPLFYGVLLLTLGGLTWRQCGMYANFETLMQATIQRNPDSAMAHNNLGNILLRKGRVEDAIIHLQTALKIDPDYAEPHANLGSALFQNGQIDEALIEYQKSVEINPNFAGSQFNLGMTLFQKGRVDEAITHYQRAVELSPNFPGSKFNLGSAFLQKGQVDEAIIYFQKALEINPNYPEAYNSLGFALYKKGRVDEAIQSAQQALQLV